MTDIKHRSVSARHAATPFGRAPRLLEVFPDRAAPQASGLLADAPRADTPRADTPRADTPRADTPRADTPPADTPRATTRSGPSGCSLPEIYIAAFRRRLAALPAGLSDRVQRCRAVLVRSRPTIAIERRMIPAAVETIFEQARPGLWRFHSQLVEVDGPANQNERSAVSNWAVDRKQHFASPTGPRLAPVFDTLASVLDSGREGKDYVLLKRVPALSHSPVPTSAA